MSTQIKNELGIITIDREALCRIAGYIALDCRGIVGMAAKNMKDDLICLLKKESLTKGIKIKDDEDGITIDFHIIVEYGSNITAIANEIITAVKTRMEETTGIKINDINVFVEGLKVDNQWT